MKMKLLPVGLLGLGLIQSCGKPSDQSSLKGHFEDASAAQMSAFSGTQVVPPEYEKSQGVIISLPAIQDYGKEKMVADFFEAGVEKVWISVPSSFRGTIDSPEFSRLRRELGANTSKVSLVKQRVSGPVTVWARDWSPMAAKTESGDLNLVDFNYYPNRQADDSTARSLLAILPLDRVSVPVYNEGGNFMTNGNGDCLMTTRVTDANAEAYFAEDMVLDSTQIKDYYKRFAGCKRVEIFPRIPYERTGHIDMWAKFLDDDTVIVNEIRQEILDLPSYSSTSRAKVQNLKNYFDARAKDIASMGFEVIRVPMPAPLFSLSGDLFRSYTNSLFLNGTALIPRYETPYFDSHAVRGVYPDAALLAEYESEILSVYQKHGFENKWVNSDNLIPYGGAIHCITMQVSE